ncbi:MAG: phosphoglycerate dehydrogenase [Pseudobdellovibrionaceae bacterium]|nr:phosphoglycerate dehydrogenase [Bdellovibrionales bacterium]USN46068.1 MAG: phosphoglycerate dehydrogenase [Pseudobdellovibrionaceae bacterium]
MISPPVKTILVAAPYTAESLTRLKISLPEMIIEKCEPSCLVGERPDVAALLIRSGTVVDAEILKQFPELKVVVTATSGFDHIDLGHCKEHRVQVGFVPMANPESAAELTIWLILSVLRKAQMAAVAINKKQWRSSVSVGHELAGKTLGIVGLGRIGSRVSELAKAFYMHVVAYDPYVSESHFERLGVESCGLMELLRQAQVVSLHVPLTDETRELINRQTLAYFAADAVLINASRGRVVNENDLIDALDEQRLAGAGLDVFVKEPLAPGSRLRDFPQVVMTPHIGAYTHEAQWRASDMAVDKIINFFQQGRSGWPEDETLC